jgi:hypothetical protein
MVDGVGIGGVLLMKMAYVTDALQAVTTGATYTDEGDG